jgi:hypothetical protein
MTYAEPDDKAVGHRYVQALVRNLDDPKAAVRIASLRATARLAGLEDVVSPDVRKTLLTNVLRRLRSYRSEDILGVSYLPEPEVREEIWGLLSTRGTIDRDRAHSVLVEAARKTTGDGPIAALIRAPYDEEISIDLDAVESVLPQARPELVTNLITSLFARLAMPVYDEESNPQSRPAESEVITGMIAGLGRRFQPDVRALFRIYQSFLPVSVRFWMEWLETMRAQEGLNISERMPSFFPIYEGELAVTRQLEWTLSRPGMNVLLEGLHQSLTSNDEGDRWAAAQLIEGAVRYAREDYPPRFGGGSGPDDVVPRSLFSAEQAEPTGIAPLEAEPAAAPPETAHAPSLPAAVPAATRGSGTPESAATGAEPVDTAVFCAPHVARESVFLVQVFLYPPHAATQVDTQARQADETAQRRGTYSLPLDLPLGTRVDLHLEIPGLTVPEPDAVLVWRGSTTAAQFEVAVPADSAGVQVIGRVRIAVAGVPAGTLRFQVVLTAAGTSPGAVDARELRARRYRRAFVSYSSKDRAEVLRRVQAFRIAGLSVFQDILNLDPGERWQKALYREIDKCDVFLLFWSHAAAASEYVGKEIEYALARKQGDEEQPPDIQPVPIDGPPIVPPPASLSGLHFNDALLAQIRAAETAAIRPTATEASKD